MVQTTSPGTLLPDVTDRAGRLIGKPTTAGSGAVLLQMAGNGSTLLNGPGIIKSVHITTSAVVATRSLRLATFPVSSKTAVASQTNIDLLDREVAVPSAGANLTIANGDVGDTVTISALQAQ